MNEVIVATIGATTTLSGILLTHFLKERSYKKRQDKKSPEENETHKNKAHLQKLLTFKKNTFTVSVPDYKVKIYDKDRPAILPEEATLMQKVIHALTKKGLEYKSFCRTDNDSDEIHLGSSIANFDTAVLLRDYHPDFKYVIPKFTESKYPNYNDSTYGEAIRSTVKTIDTDNEKEKYIVYGEKAFRDAESYAVIAKLTSVNTSHTAYLLFGLDGAGTNVAVDFFIKRHAKLYEEYEENPYFIVVPVTKTLEKWSGKIKGRTAYHLQKNGTFEPRTLPDI